MLLDTSIELERSGLHAQADQIGRTVCEVLNTDRIEGGGWNHHVDEVSYLSLALFHPRGLHLSLRHHNTGRTGDAGRRLTVTGVYPSGYGGHTAAPITVGIGTSPAHMASRIARHLIPAYLEHLDTALAEQRKAEQDELARRLMNHRMKLALPALHPAVWEPEHTAPFRKQSFWNTGADRREFPPAVARGTVRLSTDASEAEIKLTGVPAELVLRILALLDPNPPVQGRIVPRAVAPERRVLPSVRIVAGEVLTDPGTRTGSVQHRPPASSPSSYP
ncbi:hypothetical protein [Streptomyces yaizuensis]|uniref:Uncharacterized protein n=1 Tax=Streptomyces yaizuensis TaxID=2989713 RepID=A0ABQ5P6U0_9ACTN|nr:hypothetical protein [Streptomyces sp. YSPA8]GLF98274.1 hypothetical protein SYYSPA8_28275 [Streptomyces sp. YSPA8]